MRRLLAGLITAAVMVLWTALIVKLSSHAQALHSGMPQLAVTLEIAFAGVAFFIGAAPERADP